MLYAFTEHAAYFDDKGMPKPWLPNRRLFPPGVACPMGALGLDTICISVLLLLGGSNRPAHKRNRSGGPNPERFFLCLLIFARGTEIGLPGPAPGAQRQELMVAHQRSSALSAKRAERIGGHNVMLGTLAALAAAEMVEVPCLEDWMLAYSHPHAQHIARASLEREGFEAWYPLRKVVSCRPSSSLPSKTRHRRRFEIVERIEPVLGAYMMLRRLCGAFDLGRLRELHGVGGLCHMGNTAATIRDYEVELLRLAESHGRFNIYHASVPGTYRVAIEIDPRLTTDGKAGRDRWNGITRMIGRLDGAARTMVFRQELGRVIRLIESDEAARTMVGIGTMGSS